MAERLLKCSVLLVVTLLTACSSLNTKKDYHASIQQDISDVKSWDSLANSSEISYLNDLFQSPQIDKLLSQAFSENPSMQQTLLTLEMRKAQRDQTAANQLPQVEAGFSASKQESDNSSFSSSISVSWQADVWGKLKDQTTAAQLDIEQQQRLVRSAKNSLAAEILTAWLELIAQQRSVTIEQQRLTTLEKNETFILQRYSNGLGTLSDLDTARTSTASSRATLESTQQQYHQNLRNLKTLIGQISPIELTIPSDFPSVAVAPINLPKQTLAERPDLQAAYLAIQAAQLRTDVAYKALLPSFNVQALLEDVASSARDALFVSPVWSLLGQLTAPLYQGGQLRAEAKLSELETAYAYQSYRESLLNAVSEVENAIDQERSISTQLQHLTTALDSANRNLSQYQQSYRTGLVDMLDLLSVQQQTYDLESQVNNTTFELLSNRVNLALALALEIKQ